MLTSSQRSLERYYVTLRRVVYWEFEVFACNFRRGVDWEFFFLSTKARTLGALISHTIETRRMLQKIVSDSDLWTMLILWLWYSECIKSYSNQKLIYLSIDKQREFVLDQFIVMQLAPDGLIQSRLNLQVMHFVFTHW